MPNNSILGQQVKLALVMEDGSGLGTDSRVSSEVTKFDAEWVPDVYKKWPSGYGRYHYQLTGGYYRVTMEAEQMGGGFLAMARKQHAAMKANKNVPQVRLTRIITLVDGTVVREGFRYGIITQATNSHTEGNKPLTTQIQIEFADME